MSYLAWIDFDPEERRRAQTLIDLFKEPEARDELGLGTIRDGLADLLFPGTVPRQHQWHRFEVVI